MNSLNLGIASPLLLGPPPPPLQLAQIKTQLAFHQLNSVASTHSIASYALLNEAFLKIAMFNPRGNMPQRPGGPNAPSPMLHGPFQGPGPGPDSLQRQHPPAPPRMPQRVMEPEMRARFPRPNVQVNQQGMDPRQERHQKEEGCATQWDNPFPPVNSSQITSGNSAKQVTCIQNHYTTENVLSILASFGLSSEDLEELSQYPNDQLTPEKMPLILRDIRMRKMTHQLPSLPSQSREKEMFHSDDGRGTMVKWKVIDYGHERKYEYTETPLEVKVYNSDASTEGSVKGFPTQQTTLVSSAPSGVTSSQMNAVEEVLRKLGFQRSRPSTQSFPPMDASKKGTGPGLPPAGAGMPPPFGVVKASWLPVFSQADAQKLKRLPTRSMMNDYYAASPRIFPHVCSLCNVECTHLKGWNLHLGTTAHSEKCEQLRKQHPDWNPEDCSLLQRHEGDKKEKHIPLPCSTSSNPNASQHSGPGHASSQTRSRTRSPGPHSRKRSGSSERCRRKRSRSRSSERCSRKRSQSRSSERCRRKRSRSRSSERYSRKRSRSRSSKRCRRKRSRSRSSKRCSRKRSRSRSSKHCRRKRSQSRSSERCSRKRSRSRSSERCSRKRSRSKSSKHCRRKWSQSRSPRCRSRSSQRPSSPSSSSQMSSSQKRELGKSTRPPASSSKAGSSRQPPAKSNVAEQPQNNKSEHPLQTNHGHQELPKKEAATQEKRDRQPPAKSDVAEQPPNKPGAQKLKRLPTLSMINDYYAASPRIFPHVCSLCNIKCSHLKGWNLHLGTNAHSEKCEQLRKQHPDWNPEDCSLLQRHEGDKKEKHTPLPFSTSSNPNASQHSGPGHASSQTRSRTRSSRCRSRSSERPSSPSSSSQMSSSQKRELGKSTKSAASSSEAGSSRQPPVKSDVAGQPPNKSEHPVQANHDLQDLPKEAATLEQGDRQPPVKSDVAEQPPNKPDAQKLKRLPTPSMMNDYYAAPPRIFPHVCSLCNIKCRHLKDWNLHVGTAAHSEKCDQLRQQHEGDKKEKHIPLSCSTSSNPNGSQHSVKSDVAEQPPNKSERSLQTNPGHQELPKKEAATLEQGDRQPPAKSGVAIQPPNKSEHPVQANPDLQDLPKEAATLEQGDRQPPVKSDVAEQPPNKSEHPLQTNPGHQELPKKEAATQEQGDRQHEDLLRLSLTPLAEQSVMQALSLLQSGSTVGAGLAQGTSFTPLPPVQIDPASLVSMMQLVAKQVVQAALASKEASRVQESPSVTGPSPQLSTPTGSEEKRQESSQKVVPGVAPSCSAALSDWCSHPDRPTVDWVQSASVERLEASGSKGDLTPSTLLTVPWLQKKDARPPKQNLPAEIPAGLAAVRIWIVGHSIVHWASLRAAESGLGSRLGLPDHVSVSWMSRCGMRWDEFLPMVRAKVSCEGPPTAMVVQLGENDLTLVDSLSLRSRMQEDLEELATAHTGLKIFWSQLLQRRVWLGSRCPIATEKARKRTNHAMTKKVLALGGALIRHGGITIHGAALYRPDGVNLSNAGNDVWLSDVSVALMGWLQV